MPSPVLLAGLIVAGCLAALPALAMDCPAPSHMMDDVISTLKAAPSCNRAMAVFEACSMGTSGDTRLGAVVTQRCEADFIGRIGNPHRSVYRRQLQACDRKYADEDGTMYRSFTAFCRAEAAQRLSRQALKIAAPAR